MAAGETPWYRFLRSFLFPRLLGIPFTRHNIMRIVTGLDHVLPAEIADLQG